MRVLFVTQEMDPYTLESEISELFKKLPQYINEKNHEIRVLMPKYGLINERRHRLHEVVRLSGMNIIVNEEDYPLIIKVASVPGLRIQVYFLDNEEFFKRKEMFKEDGKGYDDNAERLVFFCKGALETVKKFGWPPEVVHCHGSFTSLIPLFIKKVYQNDPIFNSSKVVYTTYTDAVSDTLAPSFVKVAAINEVTEKDVVPYIDGDVVNLNKGAIHYSDGVLMGNNTDLLESTKKSVGKKPFLEFEEEVATRNAGIESFYKKLIS
jgi:starch synthase